MDGLLSQYEVLTSKASLKALITLVQTMRRVGIANGMFDETPETKGKGTTNMDGEARAASQG